MSIDTVNWAGLTTVCTPPSFIAICRQSMIHMQIKLRILITSIHYYENIVPCCDAGWDFDPVCSVWGYVFFVLFLSIFVYCNLNSLCRLTVTRRVSQEMYIIPWQPRFSVRFVSISHLFSSGLFRISLFVIINYVQRYACFVTFHDF